MTNLSVTKEVKVETLPFDHTLVVSTNGSVALFCLTCGGIKSICTYISSKKDVMLQGTYTCVCHNARNPGGDDVLNGYVLDERRILSDLYNTKTLAEMRLMIPIPHINDTYSVEFYDLMSKIHHSQTAEEARGYIVQYASMAEQRERP